VSGHWFLVPGHWHLISGSWLLVPGHRHQVPGCWQLVTGALLSAVFTFLLFFRNHIFKSAYNPIDQFYISKLKIGWLF
jgi:hypothetical protein